MSDKRELTAEEVLRTINEICKTSLGCRECPLILKCSTATMSKYAEEVVKICTKWHEEHHKPIETEWERVCRIYGVKKDGERVFCGQWELSPDYDNDCVKEILAEYVKVHPLGDYTEYIATLGQICRVKK